MTHRAKIISGLSLGLLAVAIMFFLVWRMWLGPDQMLRAIATENTDRITWITRSGIDPNSDAFLIGGFLHCATARGAIPSMNRLVELGADIDRVDGYGFSPLMVSIKMDQPAAYYWLLAKGADPSVVSRDGKKAQDLLQALDETGQRAFLKAQ